MRAAQVKPAGGVVMPPVQAGIVPSALPAAMAPNGVRLCAEIGRARGGRGARPAMLSAPGRAGCGRIGIFLGRRRCPDQNR